MFKKIHFLLFILVFSIAALYGTDINQTNLEQFFDLHCKSLQHTEIKNPSLVICFSATPGMGKTYVSKLLEEKYQAVLISSSELRRLVRQMDPSLPTEAFLEAYMSYFLDHYQAPNQFFILDVSIDRKYKTLFSALEEKKMPYVVIRLQVPPEDVLERLSLREGKENYIKFMDGWRADYEAFQIAYPSTFVLKNSIADPLAYDALYEYIDRFVK